MSSAMPTPEPAPKDGEAAPLAPATTATPSEAPLEVVLFYKYVEIGCPEQFGATLEATCSGAEGLSGRILVAGEGVNGTAAGPPAKLQVLTQFLERELGFVEFDFKRSTAESPPFPDAGVFVRLVDELISSGGSFKSIPAEQTGQGYLTPREFKAALQARGEDTVVLDVRNRRECMIGRFEGSIAPPTTNFAQYPRWLESNKEMLKDKKVIMYCTGGIRCEKACSVSVMHVPSLSRVPRQCHACPLFVTRAPSVSCMSPRCRTCPVSVMHVPSLSRVPRQCHACPLFVTRAPSVSCMSPLCHACPVSVMHVPSLSCAPRQCHACPLFVTRAPSVSCMSPLCHACPVSVMHVPSLSRVPRQCHACPLFVTRAPSVSCMSPRCRTCPVSVMHVPSLSRVPRQCHACPLFVTRAPSVSCMSPLCHACPVSVMHVPSLSCAPRQCHACPLFVTRAPSVSCMSPLCHACPVSVMHVPSLSRVPRQCHACPLFVTRAPSVSCMSPRCRTCPVSVMHVPSLSRVPRQCHACPLFVTRAPSVSCMSPLCHTCPVSVMHVPSLSCVPGPQTAAWIRTHTGAASVGHLQGGIHRYLEEFGVDGVWKGKNFVFDQRQSVDGSGRPDAATSLDPALSVGRCEECGCAHDVFGPGNVCCVCREPVLICDRCRSELLDLHCADHRDLRHCYFTDLSRYSPQELDRQASDLTALIGQIADGKEFKNRRRTLRTQLLRVEAELRARQAGSADAAGTPAASGCRSCGLADCTGGCWGFFGRGRLKGAAAGTKPTPADAVGADGVARQAAPTPASAGDGRKSRRERQERQARLALQVYEEASLRGPPCQHRDPEGGVRRPPPAMRVIETVVKGRWVDEPVLDVCATHFPAYGDPDLWRRRILAGLLTVDGAVPRPEDRFRSGQKVAHTVHWHDAPVCVPPRIKVCRCPEARTHRQSSQSLNSCALTRILQCTTEHVHRAPESQPPSKTMRAMPPIPNSSLPIPPTMAWRLALGVPGVPWGVPWPVPWAPL